jgi:hypothetical protein
MFFFANNNNNNKVVQSYNDVMHLPFMKLSIYHLVICNIFFPVTPMSGDEKNYNKKLKNGLELNMARPLIE